MSDYRIGLGLSLICCIIWLVSCQNTIPPENIKTETPFQPSSEDHSWLYSPPYPYPISTPSPIPYPVANPVPDILTIATKMASTIEPGRITTMSPEEVATIDQQYKDMATITLGSYGKTVTINLTSRFSVFLDDVKYPVKNLTCDPEWVMGYISNGSFRGPFNYPVTYEAFKLGKCTLRNGDFSVIVIVVEPTPYSPSLTPLPTYAPVYP